MSRRRGFVLGGGCGRARVAGARPSGTSRRAGSRLFALAVAHCDDGSGRWQQADEKKADLASWWWCRVADGRAAEVMIRLILSYGEGLIMADCAMVHAGSSLICWGAGSECEVEEGGLKMDGCVSQGHGRGHYSKNGSCTRAARQYRRSRQRKSRDSSKTRSGSHCTAMSRARGSYGAFIHVGA